MARRFKFGITVKILVAFLVLSLASLVLLGILAYTNINKIGQYSIENSAAALERQARGNLASLARDQAALSNALFERVAAETNILVDFTAGLWANRSQLGERLSRSPEQPPGDEYSSSIYYLAPNVVENTVNETVSLTSYMDDVFRPMLLSDRNLTWAYIGTNDGVFRVYPWLKDLPASFDPKTRPWYKRAIETGKSGWTDPYIDAGGKGLAITRFGPVYDKDGTIIGVIGVDVTIETINHRIINTQVGKSGYAFMVDSSGKVIARPGLSSGDERWDESFKVENLLETQNLELRAIIMGMVAGVSEIGICELNGEEKYIAYAPVSSTGWSIGIVAPVSEIVASADATAAYIQYEQVKMQQVFGGTIFSVLIVVTLVAFWLSRKITRPILLLTRETKAIGSGQLDRKVEIKSGDELEDLANSFNKMSADLKNYMEELRRTTAEKERMARELEIARGIQQNFLPASTPQIEGVEVAAFNVPAWEVGGDFYDFIPIATNKWGLVIADVSGKGVPAALFMALSRTLIRAYAAGNPTVSQVILRANDLITEDDRSSMFVTLFYGVFNPVDKTLTYVNAGHNSPLMQRTDQGDIVLLAAKGIAMGVMPHIELEEKTITLHRGDIIVLYTDGVTEAINGKGEQFGQERLTRLIDRNATAQELIKRIQQEVTAFAEGQPQFDDITLMTLKVS